LRNVFVCANAHDPWHVVGASSRWTFTDLPCTLRVTVRSGTVTLNFVMPKGEELNAIGAKIRARP